ncbi:hypothetical protein FOD75_11325 (plasmid) [Limosilactobacillus reuteri]|uniref:Uncharacterized protein n=1 Tax=Limosilactobacillus reuteri TaxID=1598 RepID=A0A517D8K7_LIMRT|nr:hypothetical protein [Limosilactobacillus reuteri]QDR73675.1 hypothetical protein FOD75_11325 [Limosilactobacillus reuteri]
MARNNRNNVRRINQKDNQINLKKYVWPGTIVVWILMVIDSTFVVHNSWVLTATVSVAILAFAFTVSNPGKLALKFHDYGFWNTIIHFGHPKVSQSDRRRNRRRR